MPRYYILPTGFTFSLPRQRVSSHFARSTKRNLDLEELAETSHRMRFEFSDAKPLERPTTTIRLRQFCRLHRKAIAVTFMIQRRKLTKAFLEKYRLWHPLLFMPIDLIDWGNDRVATQISNVFTDTPVTHAAHVLMLYPWRNKTGVYFSQGLPCSPRYHERYHEVVPMRAYGKACDARVRAVLLSLGLEKYLEEDRYGERRDMRVFDFKSIPGFEARPMSQHLLRRIETIDWGDALADEIMQALQAADITHVAHILYARKRSHRITSGYKIIWIHPLQTSKRPAERNELRRRWSTSLFEEPQIDDHVSTQILEGLTPEGMKRVDTLLQKMGLDRSMRLPESCWEQLE